MIVKLILATILLIALILGFVGHFGGRMQDVWKNMDGSQKGLCEKTNSCSTDAQKLEIAFLVIATISFVVAIIMIIVGCIKGQQKIRVMDACIHLILGVAIFVAGICIVSAAVMIDNNVASIPTGNTEEVAQGMRALAERSAENRANEAVPINGGTKKGSSKSDDKFYEKVGAGVLAMLDGIFYVIMAICHCTSASG